MPRNRSRGRGRPDPAGVLVVNKPKGPTSHDIVDLVRKQLRVRRVGHTGTLDPMAEGVLVLCLGEATKLANHLTGASKAYTCEVRLGTATDTQDATGEVTEEGPDAVEPAALEAALDRFRGQIEQIPPMYSALKQGGKRLYELARAGEVVEREPRLVHIYELQLTRHEGPELQLEVACSKGTYMRSLAYDLGQAVGCPAHLAGLVRTRVGPFGLERAVTVEEIEAVDSGEAKEALLEARLYSMSDALGDLPALYLDAMSEKGVRNGRKLDAGEVARGGGGGLRPGQLVRLLDEAGALVALGESRLQGVAPIRVFGGAPA